MHDLKRLAVASDRGVRRMQRVRDLRADVGGQRLGHRGVLPPRHFAKDARRQLCSGASQWMSFWCNMTNPRKTTLVGQHSVWLGIMLTSLLFSSRVSAEEAKLRHRGTAIAGPEPRIDRLGERDLLGLRVQDISEGVDDSKCANQCSIRQLCAS